jgi:hypothetical protein
MNTPKYETNKYRSYREAFEGGVSETMKLNNVISIEELESWINDQEDHTDLRDGTNFVTTTELREFINSKIN